VVRGLCFFYYSAKHSLICCALILRYYLLKYLQGFNKQKGTYSSLKSSILSLFLIYACAKHKPMPSQKAHTACAAYVFSFLCVAKRRIKEGANSMRSKAAHRPKGCPARILTSQKDRARTNKRK